jgi:hypothetical protein
MTKAANEAIKKEKKAPTRVVNGHGPMTTRRTVFTADLQKS